MSEFKKELMKEYKGIEYFGCDISDHKNVDEYINFLKKLMSKDEGKEIYFINLSEGLTPYIKYEDMENFNNKILTVFNSDKSYQFIDSIVWKENPSRLNVAKDYGKKFNSTVKDYEQFLDEYSLGLKNRYDVFHPATEVFIAREYKAIMLLKLLNSDKIIGEQLSQKNQEDIEELNNIENNIREYYNKHKNDSNLNDYINISINILNSKECQSLNDFEILSYFNESFKEKTQKDFLDTELFNFLFELSNACQSSKYLWNMTLAPKAEHDEQKFTTKELSKTFVGTLLTEKQGIERTGLEKQ